MSFIKIDHYKSGEQHQFNDERLLESLTKLEPSIKSAFIWYYPSGFRYITYFSLYVPWYEGREADYDGAIDICNLEIKNKEILQNNNPEHCIVARLVSRYRLALATSLY